MISRVSDFFNGEVLLDACEENGRINISSLEDKSGFVASSDDIEKWKEGEMKLYNVTYSGVVKKVTRETVNLNSLLGGKDD